VSAPESGRTDEGGWVHPYETWKAVQGGYYPRDVHTLKTWQPFWDDVFEGHKTFEVRRDDRGYKVGDLLVLQEWADDRHLGGTCFRVIAYVLRDGAQFGVREGHVVLGIRPVRTSDLAPQSAEKCWCGGGTRTDDYGVWCLEDIHHDPDVAGKVVELIHGPENADLRPCPQCSHACLHTAQRGCDWCACDVLVDWLGPAAFHRSAAPEKADPEAPRG
jgi:hypothetical protein